MMNYLEQEIHTKNLLTSAGEALTNEALKYLGMPSVNYVTNNMDPTRGMNPEEGFDCSGFVTFLIRQINFPFPNVIRLHANEFFDNFGIDIGLGCQRKGDLVFFSRNGLVPTHIGIMVSAEEYIHAPGKNNSFVSITKLQLIGLPPVEDQRYNINPIGFRRLAIQEGRWRIPVK